MTIFFSLFRVFVITWFNAIDIAFFLVFDEDGMGS